MKLDWKKSSDEKPEDFIDVLVFFPTGYDIANWDTQADWWSLPNNNFDQPDAEPIYWSYIQSPEKA